MKVTIPETTPDIEPLSGPWPIRNLDRGLYRQLRARSVLEGRTVGDCINEAIKDWLGNH